MQINIPGFGVVDGDGPIVIMGPNGSGKTRLALQISQNGNVTTAGAQRRTWVDDALPVQEEENLRSNIRSHQDNWRSSPWRPTDELNYTLSTLIQEHSSALSAGNELALAAGGLMTPVDDTKLIQMQQLWSIVYPDRKLEISGFFPKVRRLDVPDSPPYSLKSMSDGERSVLYLAARILLADPGFVQIDEPELHLHSRLSVEFWNAIEKARPDCRFIYITHDLVFALSRRNATYLLVKPGGGELPLVVEDLPEEAAVGILGAATLPFHAKRIFFYEGEPGTAFANEFFSSWFLDRDTFAVPAGDRGSVIAAVAGLNAVGIVGGTVCGLVDRDFYSEDVLLGLPEGITVMPLHELESAICGKGSVTALARHLGKDGELVWQQFVARIQTAFSGKTLSHLVSQRVRYRLGDLLDGAFSAGQIQQSVDSTKQAHRKALVDAQVPETLASFFDVEEISVQRAVSGSELDILRVLPGKHLLGLLVSVLGFKNNSELTNLVVAALRPAVGEAHSNLANLGSDLENALAEYFPPRVTPSDGNMPSDTEVPYST